MVAVVIPAAGSSSRMRFPKGAVLVGGSTLLRHQCNAVFQVLSSVVVVVGWSGSLVARGLPLQVQIVKAPRWWRGTQADSVRLALDRLPRCPVLVQPTDVPPPTAAVIEALLAENRSAVPCYHGRRGHPVLLGLDAVDRLRSERPAEGLRTLLEDAVEVSVEDPRVTWNLNDPRALVRWLRSMPPAGPPVRDGQ